MKIKNKNKIEFICPICKTREKIPTEVVRMMDELDGEFADRTLPPRFECNNCEGKMVPILYIGISGHIYTYTDYMEQNNL